MVNADLRATKAGEKRLGVVRAGAVPLNTPLMIDALGQIAGVQRVPMRRFVGMNR